MKISKRLTGFITLIFNTKSAIGGTATTIGLVITQGPKVYKKILEIVTPILEYLYPSMPPQDQILNLLTLIFVILFYILIWLFIFFAFRIISKEILTKYTLHILLDLKEQADEIVAIAFNKIGEERLKGIEDTINKLLQSVTPLTPVSGITTGICTIPGVYKIQEKIFEGLEKTFAKDELFPPATHPLSRKEVKVTWVYQNPTISEQKRDDPTPHQKKNPHETKPPNKELTTNILSLLERRKHLGLTTIRSTELPPNYTVEEMHNNILHCLEQGYIEGPPPLPQSDDALLQMTEKGTIQLTLMTTTLKDTRPKTL